MQRAESRKIQALLGLAALRQPGPAAALPAGRCAASPRCCANGLHALAALALRSAALERAAVALGPGAFTSAGVAQARPERESQQPSKTANF